MAWPRAAKKSMQSATMSSGMNWESAAVGLAMSQTMAVGGAVAGEVVGGETRGGVIDEDEDGLAAGGEEVDAVSDDDVGDELGIGGGGARHVADHGGGRGRGRRGSRWGDAWRGHRRGRGWPGRGRRRSRCSQRR